MDPAQRAAVWESRGSIVRLVDLDIFVLDLPPWSTGGGPAVLVLHGFPSCSYDWHAVIATLAKHRRIVLFDLLGFGLSAKPDRRYTLSLQADIAEALVRHLELSAIALVSHDIGDSIGGEILARSLDGTLGFEVRERILTNGSIYMDLAQLTDGQRLLLSLPDARLEPGFPDGATYKAAVRATYAAGSPVDDADLDALWSMTSRDDGELLLPRTIRYVEERRANERRFTGAIEEHPSPLTVIWGDEDSIAVPAMAERLVGVRPDATLVVLDGVGHYPMVEDPKRFAEAAARALAVST